MSVRNVSRALIASPFFSAGGFPSTTDGFVERDQLEALTVQISTVVPLRDVEAAAPGQVERACFTGATKPVALGSVRVTTRGRAAFAGAARGDRRAVPAVAAGALAAPLVGVEIAGTWRERRAGRRGAGRLGAAGGRRAQELSRSEPDDSRPAELVGHLRRGRKGLRAEELVAEEMADVPGRRAAAARSRYDIGRLGLEVHELRARPDAAGLRDAGIHQGQSGRSLAHPILYPVAGEMVRGRLSERGRGECHYRYDEGDDPWRDAMHVTPSEQSTCPPASPRHRSLLRL